MDINYALILLISYGLWYGLFLPTKSNHQHYIYRPHTHTPVHGLLTVVNKWTKGEMKQIDSGAWRCRDRVLTGGIQCRYVGLTPPWAVTERVFRAAHAWRHWRAGVGCRRGYGYSVTDRRSQVWLCTSVIAFHQTNAILKQCYQHRHTPPARHHIPRHTRHQRTHTHIPAHNLTGDRCLQGSQRQHSLHSIDDTCRFDWNVPCRLYTTAGHGITRLIICIREQSIIANKFSCMQSGNTCAANGSKSQATCKQAGCAPSHYCQRWFNRRFNVGLTASYRHHHHKYRARMRRLFQLLTLCGRPIGRITRLARPSLRGRPSPVRI